jgi:16S rRNA A1518/A1519 N6-dimethyltransferase RsmA/KsgA/DIM1 with predicted DNA glycosylase/AP lyase activity
LLSARLILQHRAAARWASDAAPGAARWRRDFVATLGPRVPRGAFAPRPPVDTRVLRLVRRDCTVRTQATRMPA